MPCIGELLSPTRGLWDLLTPHRSLIGVFMDSGMFSALPVTGGVGTG